MLVKIVSSGRKCTSVPRFSVSPVTFIGEVSKPSRTSITRSCGKPWRNSRWCTWPSRRIVRRSHLRQRVDAAHAHAVQAARDLVAVLVELAAGVQLGQRDLGRTALGLVLVVHLHAGRNAAAVVDDADRVVAVDRDDDVVAVAGQRLVDRVVDHLEHQVVQAGAVGRVADVHAGALAHRLQAFEDLDRAFAIGDRGLRAHRDGMPFRRRQRCCVTPVLRSCCGVVGSLIRTSTREGRDAARVCIWTGTPARRGAGGAQRHQLRSGSEPPRRLDSHRHHDVLETGQLGHREQRRMLASCSSILTISWLMLASASIR